MDPYEHCSREELIEEIKRLKTAQNIFQGKKKLNENNPILSNMIALRKTMSDVLTLLLRSDQDMVIDQALLLILKFFDVDRVYIGNFEEKDCMVDFTHEVTSEGIISMREDLLRRLSETDIPWWMQNMKNGEDMVIGNVSQMPPEAEKEQYLLQLQNIKSLLVLPVFHEGKINGFIGLDCVKDYRIWTVFDIENLRMLTNIISIAIERERALGLMEHSAQQVLLSEAKFQIIFEKLPWGVELYNETGKLLDLNQADLDIFGTTKPEALGLNMFDNPNIPDWVNQKLKSGEDVTFSLDYNFHAVHHTQYYNTTIRDTIKHLRVKGIPLKDLQNIIFGYLYIVFDDTENYRKAEQIRNNLAKLKVAVDTGESIMWEYDVPTQRLTMDFSLNDNFESNENLALFKKYQWQTLDDYTHTLHPEDVDKIFNQRLLRLLKGEIHNYTCVYRRILEGKIFWFNTNVRSYKFNADGTPSKIVSYTSNITPQRESEIELIKVKEADKLKSAFLANMSHEIRTPLNAIVGFSDLIAESDDKNEIRTYLDIIHKNNELLLQLIDDILDFSKIEAGTLEYHINEVDIKEICGEVALTDSLKMDSDVKLIFDPNSPSIFVKTDYKRIVQVLVNFVNNAIKFTTKGSITIFYNQENDRLKVGVRDTGIGIAETDRQRIFDRFIKVNDFKQGTGLGLTISKTIIENLGGTIGVDSEEGKGSTFWFTLPLEKEKKADQTASLSPAPSSPVSAPCRQHSILIAEDIAENYFLLETLFKKQYVIHHAWNGQEAVELYKKHLPDLILMDIKMPGMDGFEATRQIRELSDTVPIIALTAFAYEKEKQQAQACRFTDYVVKPVDIHHIRNLVSQILS